LTRSATGRRHLALGLWCEQHGLKAEATAHFTSAVVLDPSNDTAWRHLGYSRHNGRWMSRDQIEAEQREQKAQRSADRQWEPLLKKWWSWLGDRKRRAQAEEFLVSVKDPRAVASINRLFRDGTEAQQSMAVRLYSQIDDPASTRALAALAVFSALAAVRREATELLRGREPRDFAAMLVEMIQSPMKYSMEPVRGPGSPGALLVETPRFRMFRGYDAPPLLNIRGSDAVYMGYDSNGLPIIATAAEMNRLSSQGRQRDLLTIEARTREMVAQANWKAADSQQRLIADVAEIEAANDRNAATQERVVPVLRTAVGAPDLADDEVGWHRWWYDRLGYKYEPPPQVEIAVNASPQLPPPAIMPAIISDCFAASTVVRTLDGHRPIEKLRVGDQVLSQDVTTGALSFEPVLVLHRLKSGETLRIALDNGDAIVACIYHRFWRAGQGWAMARELKAGDWLRTLGGRARIKTIEPQGEQALYNLDVARSRTFFVGPLLLSWRLARAASFLLVVIPILKIPITTTVQATYHKFLLLSMRTLCTPIYSQACPQFPR
jgi:hypothetical protein